MTTAALYPCEITHVRLREAPRRFRYRHYLWLVDIDDLPRLPWPLRALAGFPATDHLGGIERTLRGAVERQLRSHGVELAGGQVLMLASARVLGYVFNPLTVFWCRDGDGRMAAVIAEVHNTYRQRHAYLLETGPDGRAEADKEFYVSPFLPVSGRYRMRLPEPDRSLSLTVSLDIDGVPALVAVVKGQRRAATPWRLAGYAVRYPFATARVILLIRWQGLRLLARRQPVLPRPLPPSQEGPR